MATLERPTKDFQSIVLDAEDVGHCPDPLHPEHGIKSAVGGGLEPPSTPRTLAVLQGAS